MYSSSGTAVKIVDILSKSLSPVPVLIATLCRTDGRQRNCVNRNTSLSKNELNSYIFPCVPLHSQGALQQIQPSRPRSSACEWLWKEWTGERDNELVTTSSANIWWPLGGVLRTRLECDKENCRRKGDMALHFIRNLNSDHFKFGLMTVDFETLFIIIKYCCDHTHAECPFGATRLVFLSW